MELCTQVPIESHETLKWLYSHTNNPSIIENQNPSECINVDNICSFITERNLSADLKALNSMFGISRGANTKFPCLYCTASMATKPWTLETNVRDPPSRNMEDFTKYPSNYKIWSPILPFYLINVHICTLHAEIRIFDKLLYL